MNVVFRFLSDPWQWIVDQYTWFLHDPTWLVVVNLLWWPTIIGGMFLAAWLFDRRDRRRNVKRIRALDAADPDWRKKRAAKRFAEYYG